MRDEKEMCIDLSQFMAIFSLFFRGIGFAECLPG